MSGAGLRKPPAFQDSVNPYRQPHFRLPFAGAGKAEVREDIPQHSTTFLRDHPFSPPYRSSSSSLACFKRRATTVLAKAVSRPKQLLYFKKYLTKVKKGGYHRFGRRFHFPLAGIGGRIACIYDNILSFAQRGCRGEYCGQPPHQSFAAQSLWTSAGLPHPAKTGVRRSYRHGRTTRGRKRNPRRLRTRSILAFHSRPYCQRVAGRFTRRSTHHARTDGSSRRPMAAQRSAIF